MNISDPSGDEDTSSDESPVPSKRRRSDTYGASSTTSHGSALQESDDDTPVEKMQKTNSINYIESGPDENIRLSRSSLSEHCSSPNDQFDDYKPHLGTEENGETSMQSSFQDNSFYNKYSNQNKETDDLLSGVYAEKSKMSKIGFKPSQDKESGDMLSGDYSEKSKRMMSKMGFKPGKGLGKFEHGRVEPVEASTQKGRRGLGLRPSTVGEVSKDFKWSSDDSKPQAQEEVLWMPTPPEEPVSRDLLEDWLQEGPRKLTIDDETDFVDANILKGVLESKTIFDTLDDEDLRHARFRSNPYETIGAVNFLNRAAVKMANIDAIFDFMFTKPKMPNGECALDKKDILYFADVCAGPGGFSEYILYRKSWRAKGFGFTLRGRCDFKLSDFYAGPPETFNPYYGVNDDGNIFNPDNLSSLKDNVLKHTEDKGVHFLMADGGFSVEGQENIQEILSKQLYLCQCLAALMLVRTGGHFVVKLFDVFTLFSVGLIYIMYRCFEKVCIHKPVTSRPANSERYLICMFKKAGTDSAEQHLFQVNSMLCEKAGQDTDVTELVPMDIIQEDIPFYEYIYRSNSLLGERQIKNLLKIAAFSKDKSLKETTQAEMREQCLKLWQLPDKVRTQPDRMNADDTLSHILTLMKKAPPDAHNLHAVKSTVLNAPPHYIEKHSDLDIFKNVYDWHFIVLSSVKNSPDLKFFLSCGGKQVYQLDGVRWKSVVDLHITMPAKTLIYGEVVKEYRGEGNNQIYSKALHVIDAVVLGGIDVSHLPLNERIAQCALFCAAVEKPFDSQAIPIRCKRLYNMELFQNAICNLEYRSMKRVKRAVTISTPSRNRDGLFHVVGSILFIKEIKEPWVAQMSKSSGHKYYFCVENKKPRSEYYIPEEARLDPVSAFGARALWPWGDDACAILAEQAAHASAPFVCRPHMEHFIAQKIKR